MSEIRFSLMELNCTMMSFWLEIKRMDIKPFTFPNSFYTNSINIKVNAGYSGWDRDYVFNCIFKTKVGDVSIFEDVDTHQIIEIKNSPFTQEVK